MNHLTWHSLSPLQNLKFWVCFSHTCPGESLIPGVRWALPATTDYLYFFTQPDDRGTINDISVLRVTRRGTQADHFTQTPLTPGTEVQVRVDWERRFDHMQQHSGRWVGWDTSSRGSCCLGMSRWLRCVGSPGANLLEETDVFRIRILARYDKCYKSKMSRTSLVVQWLRVCLPMQGK